MEKVKITQEQFVAIEKFKKIYSNDNQCVN